ncbi:hypothetical protein K438DRAFT_2007017 [Mycena galopus ATCC 62051]|nr:hypothetical protein K438DRAFT_2007017 [Mycena galopus ATCC 62051]
MVPRAQKKAKSHSAIDSHPSPATGRLFMHMGCSRATCYTAASNAPLKFMYRLKLRSQTMPSKNLPPSPRRAKFKIELIELHRSLLPANHQERHVQSHQLAPPPPPRCSFDSFALSSPRFPLTFLSLPLTPHSPPLETKVKARKTHSRILKIPFTPAHLPLHSQPVGHADARPSVDELGGGLGFFSVECRTAILKRTHLDCIRVERVPPLPRAPVCLYAYSGRIGRFGRAIDATLVLQVRVEVDSSSAQMEKIAWSISVTASDTPASITRPQRESRWRSKSKKVTETAMPKKEIHLYSRRQKEQRSSIVGSELEFGALRLVTDANTTPAPQARVLFLPSPHSSVRSFAVRSAPRRRTLSQSLPVPALAHSYKSHH